MVLRWENPPNDRRGKGRRQSDKWLAVSKELRANPHRWAVIEENAKYGVNATAIKKARITSFSPAGAFEATTRQDPLTKRFTIYARFVG